MTPETQCKKRLKEFLKAKEDLFDGRMWWTSISDRFHSGLPDFLVILNGCSIMIEAKSMTGKLSKIQKYIAGNVALAGAKYLVATLDAKDRFKINFEEIYPQGKGESFKWLK